MDGVLDMSFSGVTYGVPCNHGGYTNDQNFDLITPTQLVSPSKNINIHRGGREKRGGTAKISDVAVSGTPRIMGIKDFVLASTQFQIFAGSDGKIYKDTTTVLKTGMSTTTKFHFEVINGIVYIADGVTTPQTWDGVGGATSNLTATAADWSGTNQPTVAILHQRGLSYRSFWLGVNGHRTTLYYSKNNTPGDTNGTGDAGFLTVPTNDATGLVAGVEFGNRLIVFGTKRAFILDDTDDDIATWGMQAAQWSGGAAHQRLVVKTPNDVLIMTEDGEIYSIQSVFSYGDYKLASVVKPAFMDTWIRENLDLSAIDDFHASYDAELRCVKFFVVRRGETDVDTSINFHIDKPLEEAWTIHDNQDHPSGYSASCSTSVKTGTTYKIYTGDYSGFLWKLEQNNKSDDDEGYYGGFRTPALTIDNPRQTKMFRRIRVVTKSEGIFYLQVKWWIDGEYQGTGQISLAGTGGIYGSGVYDTDVFGDQGLIDDEAIFGNVGKRIQVEVYNSNANEDFFVSQVMVDLKPLGVRP
jgi:hypothetical protein